MLAFTLEEIQTQVPSYTKRVSRPGWLTECVGQLDSLTPLLYKLTNVFSRTSLGLHCIITAEKISEMLIVAEKHEQNELPNSNIVILNCKYLLLITLRN